MNTFSYNETKKNEKVMEECGIKESPTARTDGTYMQRNGQ